MNSRDGQTEQNGARGGRWECKREVIRKSRERIWRWWEQICRGKRGRERDKSETSRGVRRYWVYFKFQLDRKLWQKVRSWTQRRKRGEIRTVSVAKEGGGEKKRGMQRSKGEMELE